MLCALVQVLRGKENCVLRNQHPSQSERESLAGGGVSGRCRQVQGRVFWRQILEILPCSHCLPTPPQLSNIPLTHHQLQLLLSNLQKPTILLQYCDQCWSWKYLKSQLTVSQSHRLTKTPINRGNYLAKSLKSPTL